MPNEPMKNTVNWKVFAILFILYFFSAALTMPYRIDIAFQVRPMEFEIESLIHIYIAALSNPLPAGIMFFVLSLGLWFSAQVGLETPLLNAWISREPSLKLFKDIFWSSFKIGLFLFFLCVILDGIMVSLGLIHIIPEIRASQSPEFISFHLGTGVSQFWKIAYFTFSSIDNEFSWRLFAMGFIVFLLQKICSYLKTRQEFATILVGILMAAFCSTLFNLPKQKIFLVWTTMGIVRSFILLFGTETVFGFLYWRRGLESAILCNLFFSFFREIAFALAQHLIWI